MRKEGSAISRFALPAVRFVRRPVVPSHLTTPAIEVAARHLCLDGSVCASFAVVGYPREVAQGWLVYELTGSALHVGLNGLFQAVPFILVSLYAGTVVDRMDRKKILIAVESFSTLVVLVIGILVATGNIQVWHIYAASVAYSLAGGFESPARQALIRHLVPPADLMTAVSLTSIQRKGAQIIGPVDRRSGGEHAIVSDIEAAFSELWETLNREP